MENRLCHNNVHILGLLEHAEGRDPTVLVENFSRGVSVLVHSALDFQEYDSKIDSDGCFILLHRRIGTLQCVLACIHIPPPFTVTVLQPLISYSDAKPEVPLLIVGDFNCCLNPTLDRHPAPQTSAALKDTPLARLIHEMGWVNVWRLHNPRVKQGRHGRDGEYVTKDLPVSINNVN